MFIEADWAGSAVRQMRERGDFSNWASESLSYCNHLKREDTFNKYEIASPARLHHGILRFLAYVSKLWAVSEPDKSLAERIRNCV